MKIYYKNLPRPHGGANPSDVRFLSVNKRWGLIVFNVCTLRELGMEVGDKVLFAQDEDSHQWFFCFGSPDDIKNGSKLRRSGSMLKTQNRRVASLILENSNAESATFNVSKYPTREGGREWYKILTKTPYRII